MYVIRKSRVLLIRVLLLTLLLTATTAFAVNRVSVVTDSRLEPAAQHGINTLQQAMVAHNLSVETSSSLSNVAGDLIIIAGTADGSGDAAALLQDRNVTLPTGPEALVIRRTEVADKPALILCGSDARGLMYAALDAADRISWSKQSADPLRHVSDVDEQPDILERAVSIYTMQRAHFESRLYDTAYWERYFNLLAKSRINSFVIVFGYENGGFMAPPYPYFYDVDEFPDVQFVGITPAEQQRNTQAFRQMIALAHARGIDVVPAIWDHIYRGGVQGGGIEDADVGAESPTSSLVWGVTAENLAPYNKAAMRKFLEVFPEIDGLQFRMHGESGLTKEEIPVFWHEIFTMIKQLKPSLRVDIRAKQLPDEVIDDALDQGLSFRVATKYWMEQMGLPFHPVHVNPPNQKSRRHQYADLLKYPQKYKVHWRMWNGGTTRVLLWSDPEYARRFAESAHLYNGNSFEVNEPLAAKMLAQPHDATPFALHNAQYRHYDWEFERYWHFFQVFGRMGYNPETSPEVWEREFDTRFGSEAGAHVMQGVHLASRVLPHIVASSYRYKLFPTTRGWAGKMHMGDLPTYAEAEGSDVQLFADFREEADVILNGTGTAQQRPAITSQWFAQISADILECVANAEQQIGDQRSNEFVTTITDLKILANLALYHARRMPAAVQYNLYQQTQDLFAFDKAIQHEANAIEAWRDIVRSAGFVYTDDLMMGIPHGDLSGHWQDELSSLRRELVALQQERAAFAPQSQSSPIRIHHVPVRRSKPGEPLTVGATIVSSETVNDPRCFYRSGSGAWQSEPMKPVGKWQYSWQVPVEFTHRNLEYYIEAAAASGDAAVYPETGRSEPVRIIISNDRIPPTVSLDPVTIAPVGRPIRVTVQAEDPSGIAWVRLRYRHVTQFEDYETLDMRYDRKTGTYSATIPGEFVIPEWDVMYFIEAMDTKGNGRMYPYFEDATPYVMVHLQR